MDTKLEKDVTKFLQRDIDAFQNQNESTDCLDCDLLVHRRSIFALFFTNIGPFLVDSVNETRVIVANTT